MVRSKATGHEGWLIRLLCLAVSVGVHAGLVAVSWQSPAVPPLDRRRLTVVLVERSAAAPTPTVVTAPPARRSGTPAVAGPKAPPAVSPPVPATPVEPAVIVPEQTVVEEPAEAVAPAFEPSSRDATGDATGNVTGDGAGSDAGISRPGGAAGRKADTDGGLIKATPRYEANAMPRYPPLARQNRWEGTVRLRAKVTASGVVEAVSLERSSGYEILDRSALDGVLQWRFIPATRGGEPVASEVSIPVAFRLTE